MYGELHETWRRELSNTDLEQLAPDFYARLVAYFKRLNEESRMLDKRTVKASLLKKEMSNTKRMAREIIQRRYRKLMAQGVMGERPPLNSLTAEEKKIYVGFEQPASTISTFVENVLRGKLPNLDTKQASKKVVLRFSKDVPTIIGADMNTYGPLKIEDVASLPIENARILSKQGLAEEVEIG